MIIIYGIIDKDGIFYDASNSLLGVKQYATRNGYTKVGKRVGYNAFLISEKINGKWQNEAEK